MFAKRKMWTAVFALHKGVGRNLGARRLYGLAGQIEDDIEVSTLIFSVLKIETDKALTILSQSDLIDKI
jgi:hypothetical protein